MDEAAPLIPDSIDALEVYWRPGCPFCYRLLDALQDAGVRMRLHNIWEDDHARAVVAGINNGNETVPTVVLGEKTSTNPSPKELLEMLREEHPELLDASNAARG